MFRTIDDFANAYTWERDTTLKVLRALTDESLSHCKVAAENDTPICDLAWHIVEAVPLVVNQIGLGVTAPPKPVTLTASAIADTYSTVSDDMLEKVRTLSDADLGTLDTVFGMQWPKGVTLGALISHEVHHRGQLSVMMRQAGLTVPSIYGPNKEETAAWKAQNPQMAKV